MSVLHLQIHLQIFRGLIEVIIVDTDSAKEIAI